MTKWELFGVNDMTIDVDFGRTYGEEFAFLNERKPFSILLAKGSESWTDRAASIAASSVERFHTLKPTGVFG